MNQSRLALCVIGCGNYAADFASSVQSLSGEVDLYFASRDAAKAEEYCQRFHGKGFFGSYTEAAVDARVDALYVCTPHHLHREHSEIGIRHGKHILVEKPLAHSLEDGLKIVQAADAAGVTLMVAENVRYLAQVRQCRELVAEGVLGEIRLLQFQEEYPFNPGGWRSQQSLNGGGVFIDGGIHKVHFMRYLMSEPEAVSAAQLPRAMVGHEGEDGVVMMLRWSSGAVGLINHSWTAGKVVLPTVTVSGPEGRIHFEVGSGRLDLQTGDSVKTWQFLPDNRGLPEMVREFQRSILEGREPETSGKEGLRDLQLVVAAYESARLGTTVPIGNPGMPPD